MNEDREEEDDSFTTPQKSPTRSTSPNNLSLPHSPKSTSSDTNIDSPMIPRWIFYQSPHSTPIRNLLDISPIIPDTTPCMSPNTNRSGAIRDPNYVHPKRKYIRKKKKPNEEEVNNFSSPAFTDRSIVKKAIKRQGAYLEPHVSFQTCPAQKAFRKIALLKERLKERQLMRNFPLDSLKDHFSTPSDEINIFDLRKKAPSPEIIQKVPFEISPNKQFEFSLLPTVPFEAPLDNQIEFSFIQTVPFDVPPDNQIDFSFSQTEHMKRSLDSDTTEEAPNKKFTIQEEEDLLNAPLDDSFEMVDTEPKYDEDGNLIPPTEPTDQPKQVDPNAPGSSTGNNGQIPPGQYGATGPLGGGNVPNQEASVNVIPANVSQPVQNNGQLSQPTLFIKDITFPQHVHNFVGDDTNDSHRWLVQMCTLVAVHKHRYQDRDILLMIDPLFVPNSPAQAWWSVHTPTTHDWESFKKKFSTHFIPTTFELSSDPLAQIRSLKQHNEVAFANYHIQMLNKLAFIDVNHKPTDDQLFKIIQKNMLVKYKRDPACTAAKNIEELLPPAQYVDQLTIMTYIEDNSLSPTCGITTIEKMAAHKARVASRVEFGQYVTPKKLDFNQVESFQVTQPLSSQDLYSNVASASYSQQAPSTNHPPRNSQPSNTNNNQSSSPSNNPPGNASNNYPNVQTDQQNNPQSHNYNGRNYKMLPLMIYLSNNRQLVLDQKLLDSFNDPTSNVLSNAYNTREPFVADIPKPQWHHLLERPFDRANNPCFGCGWPGMPIRNCPRCRTNGEYRRNVNAQARSSNNTDRNTGRGGFNNGRGQNRGGGRGGGYRDNNNQQNANSNSNQGNARGGYNH
jgi:hypothetical protein